MKMNTFPETLVITQKYLDWYYQTFYPHKYPPFKFGEILHLLRVSGHHAWYTETGDDQLADGIGIFDFELYLFEED